MLEDNGLEKFNSFRIELPFPMLGLEANSINQMKERKFHVIGLFLTLNVFSKL